MGNPQFLSICCPKAGSGHYGYPGAGAGCGCPAAQFKWKQSRITGRFCGYPEIVPTTPPKYYRTLNWADSAAGPLTQTGAIVPQNFTGSLGAVGTTIGASAISPGAFIPGRATYTINITGTVTYVNNYSGEASYYPPDIGQIEGDAIPTPCAEFPAGICTWSGILVTTTDWEWSIAAGTHFAEGDTLPDGSTAGPGGFTVGAGGMSNSGSIPDTISLAQTAAIVGSGGGGFGLDTTTPTGYGNLIPDDPAVAISPPHAGDDSDYGGPGNDWGPLSSTAQVFSPGGTAWSGGVQQSLADEQVETTIIAASSPYSVTLDGGAMGGGGGFLDLFDQTYKTSGGPNDGDGVDYVGPLWADRSGRMIDYANDVKFSIAVSNLVAGMPMKCTVRIYRASYSVDSNGSASYGSPSQVGSDLEFDFTPSGSTYTIGGSTPSETLFSGDVSQGWIYGAEILGVEPQ